MILQPDLSEVRGIVRAALDEDVGRGDVTTQLLIPPSQQAVMQLVAREPLIACGAALMPLVFKESGGGVQSGDPVLDGQLVAAGQVLIALRGPAKILLTGERVALNLLQRMCGVATETAKYVAALDGTKAALLDTRKTMPGLRILDKYAVRAGGGQNHRMRLDDMVLIKDNHIALAGSITAAIAKARAGTRLPVVIECDTLEQVKEAIAARPDRILLDNMPPQTLKEAVALAAGKVKLEASGGVTLETIRAIAQTGVDYISSGAVTHSARAVDIGADVTLERK